MKTLWKLLGLQAVRIASVLVLYVCYGSGIVFDVDPVGGLEPTEGAQDVCDVFSNVPDSSYS